VVQGPALDIVSINVPIIPPEPDHPDREHLRRLGRQVRKRLAANTAVQRLAVDKAELWAVSNFLDPLECGRLISMIDAVARPSTTYLGRQSEGVRTSFSARIDPRDPFLASLHHRLDDLLGLDSSHAEAIEGQRYTVGQEFKLHLDWFQQRSSGWAREAMQGGQRSYTAMAYLNAVEGGGETDFPRLDIAIQPRPGMLLIWNNADEEGVPNPYTIHCGHPVTRGVKYVFTRWYRCRKCA
jgi:prolyl 4-hydroxylase